MARISAVFDKGVRVRRTKKDQEDPGGPRRRGRNERGRGRKSNIELRLVLNRAWLPLSITSTIRHQGRDGAQSVGHWARDARFLCITAVQCSAVSNKVR